MNRRDEALATAQDPAIAQAAGRELSDLRSKLEVLQRERDQACAERDSLRSRCAALTDRQDNLAICAGKSFPVYVTRDYQVLANPAAGRTNEKILICSVPKAGTYLFSLLLQSLGVEPTGLHLFMTYVGDYRFVTKTQFWRESRNLRVSIPITDSIRLIRAGQSAVSHLECSLQTIELLSDFRILFVYRDMRDVAVSFMRHMSRDELGTSRTNPWWQKPDSAEKMLCYLDDMGALFFYSMCHPVAGWFGRPEVLSVSFEQINGDHGRETQVETVRQIQEFCRIETLAADPETLAREVLGASTFTSSDSRTRWQDCWSDDVERRFVELGGKELNRRFGYPD